MEYYLSPWRFEAEPYPTWRSPFDDDVGLIDLRSPAQIRSDGIAEGYGLFATRVRQTIPDSIYLGDSLHGQIDTTTLKRELGLGEDIVATGLGEVIYELLTMHADPMVSTRWGCLMPCQNGRNEIWLGGRIARMLVLPGQC